MTRSANRAIERIKEAAERIRQAAPSSIFFSSSSSASLWSQAEVDEALHLIAEARHELDELERLTREKVLVR